MKNIFKKLFVICAVIAFTSVTISQLNPQPVAAGPGGFVPWYDGIENVVSGNIGSLSDLEGSFGSAIANIAYDIFLLTGYLAVCFVVYGGFIYIISKGEPGKIASSKKIITNALIGFVIAGGGSITISTIKSLAEKGPGGIGEVTGWLTGAASAAAILMIVLGGISYITSSGDPGKTQRGKSMIIAAIVGLLIVNFARIIIGFVGGLFM